MAMQKTKNKNVRKLMRTGKTTISVSIPMDYINKLNWREKQKVLVNLKGEKLIIEDWK